ncbi:MAG: lysostaphin resistance A-like protein, partial [Candidatus Hodarchaeota archaeon]
MKELNEEIIPEDSSKSHIQNKDLLYPFAVVLLMLSIFDITGNFAAIGLLAALLLGFLGSTSESMLTLLTLFLNLIAQLGSILIFIVLHQSNRIESEEKEMPHGPYLLIVLLVYSIDFIYIIFVTPLIDMILKQLATFFGISLGELVSTYEGIFPTLDLLENPLYYLLFFGVLVFGAAISEELIFRRTLIPFLERRGFGTFWVLIFSSLLFSLIHTPADLISGSIRYAIVHFFGT